MNVFNMQIASQYDRAHANVPVSIPKNRKWY